MAIPWNEENAAHLLRRAGFGGTYAEVQTAVTDGLNVAVDKLLNYQSTPATSLDARLSRLAYDLTTFGGINRWWLTRMLYSPRPLEERLTLFWHDHFATAISKVGRAEAMYKQNVLLRQYATGNFIDFTISISKDVAMLIWLDNATNRKESPNENYGRELLELFTLGQGFYSELDVYSASKAFTGWTYRRSDQTFLFVDQYHDHSQKDFLGRVGDWNGDDIVRIACGEFAHGRLIASKLFALFAYENPEQAVIDRFADVYLKAGTSVKPLVEAILKSDEMYSSKALWSKVKSPVDHSIMAGRQLMIDNDNLVRAIASANTLEGQDLFNPPDVAGWDGGEAWISSGALLARMNYGNTLTATYFDPTKFTQGQSFSGAGQLVDFFTTRLGPLPISAGTRDELMRYVAPGGVMPTGANLVAKEKGLAHMIFSLPQWQMY